jgi:hypothetical protein
MAAGELVIVTVTRRRATRVEAEWNDVGVSGVVRDDRRERCRCR